MEEKYSVPYRPPQPVRAAPSPTSPPLRPHRLLLHGGEVLRTGPAYSTGSGCGLTDFSSMEEKGFDRDPGFESAPSRV